jgi:DNA-binding SARP family transcriptional activator
MALFSVRTLGFPEIRCDDRPCRLALRKGLALLIYLAEANGPVGRDVVATMLWPESSEEVARARLRRLLHRLQLTLGCRLSRKSLPLCRAHPAVSSGNASSRSNR